MFRLVEPTRAFDKIRKTLSTRLRSSPLAGWNGTINVRTQGSEFGLALNKSRVAITPASSTKDTLHAGPEIIRLLLGSDDPSELVRTGGLRTTGAAVHLIPILFPAQHPQLSTWDRY